MCPLWFNLDRFTLNNRPDLKHSTPPPTPHIPPVIPNLIKQFPIGSRSQLLIGAYRVEERGRGELLQIRS